MNSKLNRCVASLLISASIFSFGTLGVSAAGSELSGGGQAALARASDRAYQKELSTNKIPSKSIWNYSKVTLTYGGRTLSCDARKINGVTYVALRSFAGEFSGLKVKYNSTVKTLYITGKDIEISATDGSNIIYANGRVIYSLDPNVIMTNGRMYVPVGSIAKALSLSAGNVGNLTTSLSGTVRGIKSGLSFYRDDEVLWLARIISAESQGEPLLGQIAVGCVVLNRVKSPQYPNTIWSVIFDKKYGVQFSPVANGTIYNNPTASAITAAKICLEGFSVDTGVLFFLYPEISTSSWITKTREYAFSIGNHDFYR